MRYSEAAEELAPLLLAAEQLAAFSQARLTQAQRLRAKVALREELAAQRAQRERGRTATGFAAWARLRIAPLVATVAALLFVTITVTTVAASQPGDFAYPVRVAVERAPALVQPSAAGRAAAELAAADRRLKDLANDDQGHSVAVDALLASDEAAIARAAALGNIERENVAARIAGHAAALVQMADEAGDPLVAARLREAASQALALAGQSDSVVIGPNRTPTSAPSPTRRIPTSTSLPAAVSTPTPVAPASPTATQQPPAVAPAPTAGADSPASTSTPGVRPRLSVTPPAGATRTPILPVPGATAGPRPTLPVTPGGRARVTPTFTIEPSTSTPDVQPTRRRPTPQPTAIIDTPTAEPSANPTGTPGQASVNTPTPTPWWSTPTPTSNVPTRALPTYTPRPARTVQPTSTVAWATFTPWPVASTEPTATVIWATFTPWPTATPRPDYRATVTATVSVPGRPTQALTPEATQTPRRQRTDTPTPGNPGGAPATPTPAEIAMTATPEATPTRPPLPR